MTILVAEDYEAVRKLLIRKLKLIAPKAEVLEAENGLQALGLAKGKRVDLLITDHDMSPVNGIVLSQRLRELNPDVTIFMVSSNVNLDKYVREAAATRGFCKTETDELFAVIEEFISNK